MASKFSQNLPIFYHIQGDAIITIPRFKPISLGRHLTFLNKIFTLIDPSV